MSGDGLYVLVRCEVNEVVRRNCGSVKRLLKNYVVLAQANKNL
jgi:hypothetical protein